MSELPAVPEPGVPIAAERIAAIEREVAETIGLVDDIDEAQEWRARAAALEAYLRSKGLQAPMLGAQRRVEARIGQLLGPAPGRGRAEVNSHADSFSSEDRGNFRLVARALDGECPLDEDEWRKSRRALVALVRERLGLNAETPALPEGEYRCIVADPPWQLTTGATMPAKFGDTAIKLGGDALAYGQMPLAEIKALPVADLAADDAHLYLWTVNRYVDDAYDVVRAWGFEPSALLTWCKKQMGIGLGGTFRQTTEFVVFARRGSLAANRIVETTWFAWPRGRHSEKPPEFYELVESVTPGPRLDMFARGERPGWMVWGNEVPVAA